MPSHRQFRFGRHACGLCALLAVAAGIVPAAAPGAALRAALPADLPASIADTSPQARVTDRSGALSSLRKVVARQAAARASTQQRRVATLAAAAAGEGLSDTVSFVETSAGSGRIVRVLPGAGSTSDPVTVPARSVAWSADGSRYAIATSTGIFSRRADGSSQYKVDAHAPLGAVAWHPRGFEVAGTATVSGAARLVLAKSDGTYSWVADGTQEDGSPLAGAVLPRDPTTLTYLPDEATLAVTAHDPATGLQRIDRFDTTTQRSTRLLPDDASAAGDGVQQRDPVLAPDASRLAYVQEAADGTQSVWVMDPDGGHPNKVTTTSIASGGIAWAPDSSRLYLLTTAGSNQLKSVTVATAETTTLVSDLPGTVSSLSVRPTASPVTADRLAGTDRVGTSVAVSKGGFINRSASGVTPSCAASQALSVVLVRSDLFPDGLVAAPLAAKTCGPLLLTAPTTLDSRVLTEIKRVLQPGRTVYIIGSTAAVSGATANTLAGAGYTIVRYSGADRFATAAKVATSGLGKPSVVLFASGLAFPDALVAGAAATSLDGAVLLTNGSTRAAATDAYLNSVTQPRAAAIGGPAATAYPWAYRVSGADRYATAAKVAQEFFYPPRVAFLAAGGDFPDALSTGALAALTGNPLLITTPTALPAPIASLLDAGSAATSFVVGVGSTTSVSAATLARAVTLSGGAEPWVS